MLIHEWWFDEQDAKTLHNFGTALENLGLVTHFDVEYYSTDDAIEEGCSCGRCFFTHQEVSVYIVDVNGRTVRDETVDLSL